MSTPTQQPTRDPGPGGRGTLATGTTRKGDAVFKGTSTGAGVLILLVLAGVAAFLIGQSIPALTASPEDLPEGQTVTAYVWPLLFGTVLAAIIALLVATPIAVGIGLFISHFAPRRAAQTLGYLVDLLAAVPSIVYGIWGAVVLSAWLVPIYQWLERNAGFLPFFDGPALPSGRTMLTAGLVLAVMILPIITALSRDVFLQTPRLHEEAALALGATRWEMIRYAVIPYGRSGVVSAAMLGLGRALGETMAVALVLSGARIITFDLIGAANPLTIAANIALAFPESSGLTTNTLIASGLALFIITFLVNFAARWIVSRSGAKA
ncbi:phosphate ABC transporter permease subunit PstC [Paenibacillus sp. TRM 82003]|uniref:phosphate ABC transporter permease subunit PstC n=1 Tax=Kineococcus sp. TRM81007 TaxID=2925831 RepID=UPI001F55CB8E|nr:phosphate ABC transporter permease subunit PstC [Kineococcus sp. TRM81007]MCI2238625.1 phosphate ABC transporter permease subunit PstC [Kineococcus sp. TRM81007]MCI3927287.1 phosphate ABC transporter permease subunit PstC [Paenibacillus sp. TRM 82003]